MIYAIFHEFIKNFIKNGYMTNGEKQNCAYAEALCGPSFFGFKKL